MQLDSRRGETSVPRERGAIIVLTAMVMLVMLMIAAFATDVGAWYRQGQEQQRSADLGSLNGIQGYENERKAQFELISTPVTPVTSWADIAAPSQKSLRKMIDQASLQAAVDAAIRVLESEGHPVTQVAGSNPSYQHPTGVDPYPTDASGNPTPPQSTSATFVTDDGITVVVTRTSDHTITVSITQPGTQYFSSALADAPTIQRVSESKFSNCNADCSRDITLNPPFQGFTGVGSGDGFRPIIGNNDRIYTVNHRSGSVVCMDASLAVPAACSGWPLSLNPSGSMEFETARKPVSAIDLAANKLYIAVDELDAEEFGIACVDLNTASYCSGMEFTPLHRYRDGSGGVSYITGGGVYLIGDRLFAMGQDGRIHCVHENDLGNNPTECSGYPHQMSVYGRSWMPDLRDNDHAVHDEYIDGRLYFYHDALGSSPRGAFTCWDPTTNTECWNYLANYTYVSSRPSKFTMYSNTGNGAALGFCVAIEARRGTNLDHNCVYKNGTGLVGQIPGLTGIFNWDPSSNGYIYGEGFSLDGSKTIFGSRYTGEIFCYDWTFPGGSCGKMYTTEIYGMAKLSNDCIVAVGHTSRFTSINPDTMTNCTGSTVTTDIYPCPCGDGLTSRYGTLDLPQELKDVLNSATATVTDPSGSRPPQTHPDLLASPMELKAFDGLAGPLTLEITVNSKVNAAGDLLWTQPYNANLSLTVQPTLVG